MNAADIIFSSTNGRPRIGNEKYEDSIEYDFAPSGLFRPYPSAYHVLKVLEHEV